MRLDGRRKGWGMGWGKVRLIGLVSVCGVSETYGGKGWEGGGTYRRRRLLPS